jgi:pimeloyl-[acyl-carrier protein] methyl ester esterase
LAERGTPAGAALAAGLGWLRDTDLRADAGGIGVPTLLVHGARDQLVPVEAGRWLAKAIPGARMHELADAAHLPFFTHHDAFLAALEHFVG